MKSAEIYAAAHHDAQPMAFKVAICTALQPGNVSIAYSNCVQLIVVSMNLVLSGENIIARVQLVARL